MATVSRIRKYYRRLRVTLGFEDDQFGRKAEEGRLTTGLERLDQIGAKQLVL